jgi:chromosome partitioning protein
MARLEKVRSDVKRTATSGYLREGKGLWLAAPINRPNIALTPGNGDPKVLIVANAKGGVGKTTVAANLAARYAELAANSRPLQKPILLIDLDFQGTLSAMAIATRPGWLPASGQDSDSTYLISGDWAPAQIGSINQTAISILNGQTRAIPNLKVVRAYYDLAQAENREMINWLVSDRADDIRFRLRKLLWSNEVLNSYSMVIIDCPPRFTTAAVQAIAAATHVLIPTKLDSPSADAVVTFGRQIEIFREAGICPTIQYIGAVATMVRGTVNYAPYRQALNDKLGQTWGEGGLDGKTNCLPQDVDIPESTFFADAANSGIAYDVLRNSERERAVKSDIRRLGDTVAVRMHLPPAFHGTETNDTEPAGAMA